MKDEKDDDDGPNDITPVKYPVLPSLIALQQMRGRFKLAYLGKKLMKWTAMATNKELRVVAKDLDSLYKNYERDVKLAYIYLARGRYFCYNLNNIVLHNPPFQARLRVTTTSKSVAGVKLRLTQAVDNDIDPYPHLGIEKGGQAILDAKEAWRKLLLTAVMAVQLRTMFLQLDAANMSANKKANVLQKLVIPRITCTVKYIESELDEREREEMFRLKRFKELKTKKHAANEEKDVPPVPEKIEELVVLEEPPMKTCTVCSKTPIRSRHKAPKPEYPPQKYYLGPPLPCSQTRLPPPQRQTHVRISPTPPQALSTPSSCTCAKSSHRDVEVRDRGVSPCATADYLEQAEEQEHLEILKSQLSEVIDLAKQCKEDGIESASIEELIKVCTSAREKLEDKSESVCKVCESMSKSAPRRKKSSVATAGIRKSAEMTAVKEVRSNVSVTQRIITITIETTRPKRDSEEGVCQICSRGSKSQEKPSADKKPSRTKSDTPACICSQPYDNTRKTVSCDLACRKGGFKYSTESIKVQLVPHGSVTSASDTERQTGNINYSASFAFKPQKQPMDKVSSSNPCNFDIIVKSKKAGENEDSSMVIKSSSAPVSIRASSSTCVCSEPKLPESRSNKSYSGIADACCMTEQTYSHTAAVEDNDDDGGILNALNRILLSFHWGGSNTDRGTGTRSSTPSESKLPINAPGTKTCSGGSLIICKDPHDVASSSKNICGQRPPKKIDPTCSCQPVTIKGSKTIEKSNAKVKPKGPFDISDSTCTCAKNRDDVKIRHSDSHLIKVAKCPNYTDKRLKKSASYYYIECDCDL